MTKKGVYVKLSSGWIRVKESVRRPVSTSSRKSKTSLKGFLFGLIGEGVDGEPKGSREIGRLYISAYKVTKYIMRVVAGKVDGVVVLKPVTRETYELVLYDSTKKYLKKLEDIANELNALKKKPSRLT